MRKTQDASAADVHTRTADGAENKTSIPEVISQHSELKGKDSLPKERTLKLTVISARKLKKSGLFGKADPYVALTYGSHKTKSSVVKNNLNPEWNFDNLLTINEKASDEVLLEVYDKDTGSKDDFMGRVSLPISELTTLKQGQWIPLQKTKSGEICLSCVFVSDLESSGASGDRDAFERVESVEELETATLTDVETKKVGNQAGGIRAVKELLSAEKKPKDEFEHAKSSPGEADTQQRVASEAEFRAEDVKDELHLTVESARDLEKRGMFGKADPYLCISLGNQTVKSKTVNNNLNPDWNFKTSFFIEENNENHLIIEIYDKDTASKDDLMGKASISPADLPKLKQAQWIPLQGVKSGELFLSAEIKPVNQGKDKSEPESAGSVVVEQVVEAKNEAKLKVVGDAENAKLEEESRQNAEGDAAKAKQEEEARIKAEAEAARAKLEEEARIKAEAEARLKAEAAKAKEEEEARLKAEAAKAKEEEEERLKAEAEAAKVKQEEEKKQKA